MEEWKPSKKGTSSRSHFSSSSSSSSSKSFLARSCSTRSSSSKLPLLRSFSQKSTPPLLSSNSPNSDHLPPSYSQKSSSSICQKCSSLAKEQRARFYIMRRCVAMLVCWHKHGDS